MDFGSLDWTTIIISIAGIITFCFSTSLTILRIIMLKASEKTKNSDPAKCPGAGTACINNQHNIRANETDIDDLEAACHNIDSRLTGISVRQETDAETVEAMRADCKTLKNRVNELLEKITEIL
jgi:hypothetical protein